MQTVSAAEAKTHLSALLDCVLAGGEIVITRRGQPIARLQAEQPAVPDFSVFRQLRGAWKKGMKIDRDEPWWRIARCCPFRPAPWTQPCAWASGTVSHTGTA